MSKEKQIEEIFKIVGSCVEVPDRECDKYGTCAHCKAVRIYNAGYRKQSEWISVKDKLPEKNVRVLVYIDPSRSYTRLDTDRLDDRGFVRWFNAVTHWMPLPEAPKMKGGAE